MTEIPALARHPFHLVKAFSHHAGELVAQYGAQTDQTRFKADINGDGKADVVVLTAGDHEAFTGFVL